jgi:hypothetical protein
MEAEMQPIQGIFYDFFKNLKYSFHHQVKPLSLRNEEYGKDL